jgi:hypothetical protein
VADVIVIETQAHNRIADQLAGAMVGDAPATVGIDDLDPLRAIPALAHRQLVGGRAAPAGVDGRVFEQ